MSERNWSHWQTFAGGAIAGLALAQRPWLIFGVGIVVGVVLVFAGRLANRVGIWAADVLRRRRGALLRHPPSRFDADEYARVQREQRERIWHLRGER